MGSALSALLVLAPWLAWLPSPWPVASILLGLVAIVAALHGWGRLVARCAAYGDVPTALVIVWGLAAVVAFGGVMLALQIHDPRMFVVVGTVMHTIDVALRYREVGDKLETQLDRSRLRHWIVPAGLLLLFVLVHSLGAAGQVTARPFDDESNVIAQVHRLGATGALADPLGFPRGGQLGGFITLAALPTVFGDVQLARVSDAGLGFGLFCWLACALLRPRNGESTIWCTLVIVVAAGLKPLGNDILPFWLSATLLLGLVATLSHVPARSSRTVVPIGLVIAAACCVRHELVVIALVGVVIAWWRTGRGIRRFALLSCIAVPVGAYLIATQLAWWTIEDVGPALARRPFAWMLMLWTAGTAGLVALVASDRLPSLRRGALVIGTAACVLAAESQTAPGRRAWSWRTWELMFDAQYALHAAPPPDVYAGLLAKVPRGQRVAVWVMRPEVLDLTGHLIFDLRTPRVARSLRLDDLVYATGTGFLLLEGSEPAIASIASTGRFVASRDGVVLLDVR